MKNVRIILPVINYNNKSMKLFFPEVKQTFGVRQQIAYYEHKILRDKKKFNIMKQSFSDAPVHKI